MWNPRAWAAASHEQAIANARTASTECGRRRVERDEVSLFLAGLAGGSAGGPAGERRGDDLHIDGAPAEHPA